MEIEQLQKTQPLALRKAAETETAEAETLRGFKML
jgi:hypothetical protein